MSERECSLPGFRAKVTFGGLIDSKSNRLLISLERLNVPLFTKKP
jgi:hypothetical protein